MDGLTDPTTEPSLKLTKASFTAVAVSGGVLTEVLPELFSSSSLEWILKLFNEGEKNVMLSGACVSLRRKLRCRQLKSDCFPGSYLSSYAFESALSL